MVRPKRKKLVTKKDNNDNNRYTLRTRRSSMRVNLSFVSNLSDSLPITSMTITNESCETTAEEAFVRNDGLVNTVKKCKTRKFDKNNKSTITTSDANITVANEGNPTGIKVVEEIQSNSLNIITEKEKQLNRSCMQLKDAIMRKTQAFFDKENELSIKTSEVLASGYMSPLHDDGGENDGEFDKRSPSIRVNIGKHEQIVMSGDGRKRNPVQVSSMLRQGLPTREDNVSTDKNDDDNSDSQSIVSTPKKIRTNRSARNNPTVETTETLLRIPVTRLFADNDLNSSMSDLNSVEEVVQNSSIESNKINSSASDISRIPNKLNYATSPILSQGNRRSRLSLSLKKNHNINATQASSRLSTATINESFLNKIPLISSSFIENSNENVEIRANKTVDLAGKSDSDNICKTINLDDNSKTIDIENSTNSSGMELTTISAHTPIIRRSIKNILKSQSSVIHKDVQNSPKSNKKQSSLISDMNKELNKEGNVLESVECGHSNNLCQEDCSINTLRTSLNVNTSLDRVNSVDHIVQKENKTPNNLQQNLIIEKDLVEKENDTIVIQRLSTFTTRSSMQVNTSLDSIKKSTVSNTLNHNQESTNKLPSRQSTSSIATTVRSSMQVNTSLDSVRKSPSTRNLDFNKILSMVQEKSINESRESVYTTKEQSSDSDSDLENVSLIERIRNISATKTSINSNERSNKVRVSKKSVEIQNKNCNETNKSLETKNKNSSKIRKSAENKNTNSKIGSESEKESISSRINSKSTRFKMNDSNTKIQRKSIEQKNISSTSNESSVIEATPYPISRSVLMKTMIMNNIAMNTLDPRRNMHYSDNEDSNTELEDIVKNSTNSSPYKHKSTCARKVTSSPDSMDTVILDSSDESANESIKGRNKIVIEESLNDPNDGNMSMNKSINKTNNTEDCDNEKNNNKKEVIKRKLYPIRENSNLVSFSPAEDIQEEVEAKTITRKKKRKVIQKNEKEENQLKKCSELTEESEPKEHEILVDNVKKQKKKPRKIKSKKIVVKKVTNMSLINKILNNEEEVLPRSSGRNSSREFNFKKSTSCRKGHKINIVVTGLSKEDKDLVKSVIKTLGSASLEVNVSPRTTHVISSGVRTINLLKGIIRGCWLLSLEWALKSLESEKWLEPNAFEMCHFSKAVQENRRDRQLFGKAYVPELFVTCGFIYVENGTSPPTSSLKELIKIAGGRITDDPSKAKIIIGSNGLKEIWILDSITTGEVQAINEYKRN